MAPDAKENAPSVHSRIQGVDPVADTWQNLLTDGSGALLTKTTITATISVAGSSQVAIISPVATVSSTAVVVNVTQSLGIPVTIGQTITANLTQTAPLTVNITNAPQVTANAALTAFVVAGGLLDDVTPVSGTEGGVRPFRMTPNGAEHVNLRSVTGADVTDTINNNIDSIAINIEAAVHETAQPIQSFIPAGAQVFAGAPSLATVGDAESLAMTDRRGAHVNLRNASGDEIFPFQGVSQSTTTLGQIGALVQGMARAADPTFVSGTTNPLTLTTVGRLRVDTTGQSITTIIGSGYLTVKEDAAHVTGVDGIVPLAVRNDSLGTTFTDANGDYTPVAVTAKGVQFCQVTDTSGSNFMPTMDAHARTGFVQLSNGTAPLGTSGSQSIFVKGFDGSGLYNVSLGVFGAGGFGFNPTVAFDTGLNTRFFKASGETPVHPAATANTLATSRYLQVHTDGTLWTTNRGGVRQTYRAAHVGLALAAAATDFFIIVGSSTRTVRVLKMKVSGIQGTGGPVPFLVVKRSTADTGGTSTTLTNVPLASGSSAGTAVVRAYTVNPTTGTLVGNVDAEYVFLPSATVGPNSVGEFIFGNHGELGVLSSTSEMLALNLNSATVSAGTVAVMVEWSEE